MFREYNEELLSKLDQVSNKRFGFKDDSRGLAQDSGGKEEDQKMK